MKKIVHIIDEFEIGGAQTHLLTMLSFALQEYPIEHIVIGLFGDGPFADKLRGIGVTVLILELQPYLAARRFDLAISEIKLNLMRLSPDLVEAHLTWSRLLGLLAAKLAGVRHRVGFEQGDIYLASAKFRLANFLSQIYIDRFIVCSEALGSWVQRTHHISEKRISVLHNCVDIRRFNPKAVPASDVLALRHENSTVFVAIGTLGKGVDKRVDIVIRAIAAVRQTGVKALLVIVGDGEQRTSLEQLAVELNVSDDVHFLGMRNDVPDILAACDIFCHTAPFEPFGIVALEAMAVGLPVIIPDGGGIQEIVDDGISGLKYPPLDESALAQTMARLSINKLQQQQLRVGALYRVKENFTVESYVHRLYQLYGFSEND